VTNILDLILAALTPTEVYLGVMPPEPDTVLALQEYPATQPEHYFGSTSYIHNVQLRSRAPTASVAFAAIDAAATKLNRYQDNQVSILQTNPILDIGRDDANPPRYEYTANFTIRRL
jgi:hypothetical protein